MKFQIVLIVCLAAMALAAPQKEEIPATPQHDESHVASQHDESHAETLRMETENNGVDKYNFAYETSNGILRTEEGELKTTEEGAAIIVHGTTSWTTPDGKKFEMTFTADELGYHPIFKIVS